MEDEALREKMLLLGRLVSELAHEINTPLAAIRSNNDVLEQAFLRLENVVRTVPGHSVEDLLSIVRDTFKTQRLACERLDDIARSVRELARPDGQTWEKAAMRALIENALTLTAHSLRGRAQVMKDFGDVGEIECHPSQLSQVFVNLLINAVQAMDKAGEIRVKTWQQSGMAFVSVSDTGSGMSPEVVARLFEPGFTTKEKGLGTGLGLSICLRTIQNHRGRIDVQSQPGQGSTFVVSLPLAQQPERNNDGER